MEFARGGAAALRMLASSGCDVIVVDMRMPGMDGAQLFERSGAVVSASVAIILSGTWEADLTVPIAAWIGREIAKSQNVSKQFLGDTFLAGLLLEVANWCLGVVGPASTPVDMGLRPTNSDERRVGGRVSRPALCRAKLATALGGAPAENG